MAHVPTIFVMPGLDASSFISHRVIDVVQPAAGAEFARRVPGGRAWLLHSLRFQLVTDAGVANRVVSVAIEAEGVEVTRLPFSAVQAASLTNVYTVTAQGSLAATGTVQSASLPSTLLLLPGWRILSSTQLIEGGDQYSGIRALVTEFYYPR